VQQEVVHLVRAADLFELDLLRPQSLDEVDGLAEVHVPIVVVMDQKPVGTPILD
jgi:hypothetical protein